MLTGLSLRANEKRGMRESRDDSFKETCCKAEQRNQMYVGEMYVPYPLNLGRGSCQLQLIDNDANDIM